jgi:hypothetical protein
MPLRGRLSQSEAGPPGWGPQDPGPDGTAKAAGALEGPGP